MFGKIFKRFYINIIFIKACSQELTILTEKNEFKKPVTRKRIVPRRIFERKNIKFSIQIQNPTKRKYKLFNGNFPLEMSTVPVTMSWD